MRSYGIKREEGFVEIKNVILEEELKNVTLEKDGNLAIVTINRPKALNALNSDTLRELDLAISNIEQDSNVYCVILTGAGEKFRCQGWRRIWTFRK